MIVFLFNKENKILKIKIIYNMSEKEERLKDIKTENAIWVVYIGIIILKFSMVLLKILENSLIE